MNNESRSSTSDAKSSGRWEIGKFFILVVAALVLGVGAFILISTWLIGALNVIFGVPTGSFVLAALYLLGAVWAGVEAKKVSDRAGGPRAVMHRAGREYREVTEPAREGYRTG